MERMARVILLLSALCPLLSCASQHHFVFINTPKTWYEAQSYCRETFLDLATIDDMTEMETVLRVVQDKYDDAVWIGLWKGETRRWHWSLADKDFYKEGERSYVTVGLSNNCVLYKVGETFETSCSHERYSVCFDGEQIEQYILHTDPLTWTEARDFCRAHHTDLVSVRNEAEKLKIQDLAGEEEVWIGFFRDPWEWSDHTYSSLRYWKPDLPVWTADVGTCAALIKNESGRWAELSCEEAHPFLCNCEQGWTSAVRFITVRMISQGSALEDNEDEILSKIKQELSSRKVTGLKLQWQKNPDGRVFIKEPH